MLKMYLQFPFHLWNIFPMSIAASADLSTVSCQQVMWIFYNNYVAKFRFMLNTFCNCVRYRDILSQEVQYWIELSGYHMVKITFGHNRESGGKVDRNCVMRTFKCSISGLHPQSPRHFAPQPSARVSQTLRPSYLSHVISAAT